MYKYYSKTPIALLAALLMGAPLASQAAFQCWTNNQGQTECGNVVPPEYAQEKVETYSDQGTKTDVQKRAMTQEEIEAKRRAEEEKKRLEAERKKREAEEQRRRELQAKHDKVLLATFLTVEDIKQALERKVTLIDGTIEVTKLTTEKIYGQLNDLTKRAERLKKANKKIPEDLQEDIDSLQNQVDEKEAFIAAKVAEKKELIRTHQADIERFKELKGIE